MLIKPLREKEFARPAQRLCGRLDPPDMGAIAAPLARILLSKIIGANTQSTLVSRHTVMASVIAP